MIPLFACMNNNRGFTKPLHMKNIYQLGGV